MKKKGFTLIELLVVIAIIGLLSTLAVVSLNSARGKARDAKRVSDLKSLQTAMEMYKNDNADKATKDITVTGLGQFVQGGVPRPSDSTKLYYICANDKEYLIYALLEYSPQGAGNIQSAGTTASYPTTAPGPTCISISTAGVSANAVATDLACTSDKGYCLGTKN